MARISIVYHGCMLLLAFGCRVQGAMEIFDDGRIEYMSREERQSLKQEAKEMFYHAYNAYMDNAYPADELMPLSCKGRYRGSEQDRGDIDSVLGNFSLTLVDTLDTLVVMNDLAEFEKAVKLVIKGVTFDTDVIVSLFETNIRILGGLLSGHVLADNIKQRENAMPWYKGELLSLAKDLGYRFLPAFNTTTGIPFGRINLKSGMKGVPLEMMRETCTACAGSMILEMAALSRLTGEPIFEEKAQKAMDVLWKLRHRGTDLMGSVLNVNSGDWVRRDSGVGAGIDSYYEYCLKAYILLGDEKYLGRFNKHYSAIMKYISQGPMLLDVHMHRPNTNSKNFMDALLAFWPGLQVLKGDIKPAVETHEMLYQVMQRHNFIPEAFTTDFQVHWGHHPLRPEFLESTYFLYKATGDHYYLGVGRKVLKSLQTYARVSCGFAAVSDVRTNKHDDTMDSFVLSETFKYLYLLFADPSDLKLNLDEYVFTTEGHLLPLSLASVRFNVTADIEREKVHVEETDRTCPNSVHLFPASVRQPLRNMVEDVCPKRLVKKRLSASQFVPSNLEHTRLLSDMGITILTLSDGSVQLLHTFSNAKSTQDAEEGLLFMHEMVELSKSQSHQQETRPVQVAFIKPNTQQKVTLLAGPAQFGIDLRNQKIVGKLKVAYPSLGCEEFKNPEIYNGKIVVVDRGNCMFIDKARILQKAGAIAGIVLDNTPSSSVHNSPMFAMSGDGKQVDDVTIPFVFLFSKEARQLLQTLLSANGNLHVTIGGSMPKDEVQLKAPTDQSMFEKLKGTLKEILSRELASQNSPSTATQSQAAVTSDQEQMTYAYLQAGMDNTPDADRQIRISVNLKSNFNLNSIPRDVTFNESNWWLLKKLLVNELFGTMVRNNGIVIATEGIEKVYSLVMRDRGIDEETIGRANVSEKIVWFLKELSGVGPDAKALALYTQLHHQIDMQHLLSYLFRDTASNIRQHPDLNAILKSDVIRESYIRKLMIRKYADVLDSAQMAEYDKFMKKYMPIIIRYIIEVSLNLTSTDDLGKEIWFINNYISNENDLSIVKRIFANTESLTNKLKTAEISKTKKGVVRIELPSDTMIENESQSTRQKAQRGDIEIDDPMQSSSIKRVKGDKIEDVTEPMSSVTSSKEKGENKSSTGNQAIEKSVPTIPVKDSESSSDKNHNKVPLTTDNYQQPTVGSKRKRKHAHEDL